ncbi:MAG TPA: hypothetical protein DD456_00690 [Stenotrophomonas sp.]|nr:hypothetical protein [Stenotrophomonas sp.]
MRVMLGRLRLRLRFCFLFLTFPAVERAEHHSGTGGEEAHVSERSELCAAPLAREERREPAGAARRIASRPVLTSHSAVGKALLLVTSLCTSKEK